MKNLVVVLFIILITPFSAHALVNQNGTICDFTDAGTQDGTWQDDRCVSNGTHGSASTTDQSSGQNQQGQQSGFTALAPIPGLTDPSSTSAADSSGLANFFNNLYKYLIGLAAVLAIIEIIWGGFEIASESVTKKTSGKERIREALIGLVLVLAPVLVFSIINPSILNLSLNLQKIESSAPPPAITGGSSVVAPIITSSGCTVTGIRFQTATCSKQQAAQDFVAACPSIGRMSDCKTVNSSGCTDTSYTATCESLSLEEYVFLDRGNIISTFSSFVPLAASSDNSKNGEQAVAFARLCASDGGVVCLVGPSAAMNDSLVRCPPYTSSQSASQNNYCYADYLACKDPAAVSAWSRLKQNFSRLPGENAIHVCGDAGSNPNWTPIQ